MWSFANYKDNCNETMMKFFNSMDEGFAVHKLICDDSKKRFKKTNRLYLP